VKDWEKRAINNNNGKGRKGGVGGKEKKKNIQRSRRGERREERRGGFAIENFSPQTGQKDPQEESDEGSDEITPRLKGRKKLSRCRSRDFEKGLSLLLPDDIFDDQSVELGGGEPR